MNLSEKRVDVIFIVRRRKIEGKYFKKISFILHLCNCRKSIKKFVQEVQCLDNIKSRQDTRNMRKVQLNKKKCLVTRYVFLIIFL